MDGGVRVVTGPNGEALAVKRASGTAAERLRREATVLERIAGPGAVRLASVVERDGTVELATAYVGPRTLADVGAPLPSAGVATIGAALASTLARAHGRGIVHGRVLAEHVLLGAGGSPVLCGWGAAPPGAVPSDDVAALGRLLLDLLAPRDRSPRHAAAVRTLASNCVELDATSRPAMTAVAAALGASASTPVARQRRPRAIRRATRWRAAAVGGMALVAMTGVVLVTAAAGSSGGREPGLPATSGPMASDAAPTSSTATVLPRRVWPPSPAPESRSSSAPVLAHDGARFAVGGPGDVAVAGDWSCTGIALPAVLRPATGLVYAFDTWPGAGQESAGRRVAEVGPALGAEATDIDGDGCDELAVTLADGTIVAVRLEP